MELLPTAIRHSTVIELHHSPNVYLVLLPLRAHDQRVVGDLIGFVLLVGFHCNSLWTPPVFAINDGMQIPCLIGLV